MARAKTLNPWAFTGLAMQSAMLAFEANQVITLRLARLAMGAVPARTEVPLMVSEKMKAAAVAGQMVMASAMGGKPDLGAGKVVRHYRRKVRANKRRLT